MMDKNTDIIDIHGYVKGNFFILHSREYDHKDGDTYIYKSREIAINPLNIMSIEQYDEYTKICFTNKEYYNVYESFDEILELLEKYNKVKNLNS